MISATAGARAWPHGADGPSFSGGSFETGGYGFDLTKTGLLASGDQFGLRIAQPLRVEHGGFAMLLPTAYDYTTATATNTISRFSLTPSGREVDAELSYGLGVFGDAGWLGGNLYVRRQPGHIADAPNDVGGAARLSFLSDGDRTRRHWSVAAAVIDHGQRRLAAADVAIDGHVSGAARQFGQLARG